ncbi:Dabb family protein [Microbacterium paraoxydans]|uniref:Dabb family protein n=1 Tax=Microbacterium paraoxydans TaxID=199592 RepID=UPI0030139807
MPIQHTVVFRLVHPEGSAEEREFLATGHAVLAAIPGVGDFAIRRQISVKSALRHQFSMVFADQAAYDAYDAHPAHRAFVAERWLPEVADFQEYDFVG